MKIIATCLLLLCLASVQAISIQSQSLAESQSLIEAENVMDVFKNVTQKAVEAAQKKHSNNSKPHPLRKLLHPKKDFGGKTIKIPEQKTPRDEIEKQLEKEALDYLANFDQYQLVLDKPKKNYRAAQTWTDDGLLVNISKYKCANFTQEHLKNYTDDRAGMVVAMNQPDMSGTKLPSDEGHQVVLLHEHIPFFFITDRDMIATFYHTYDSKTGFHNYFDSSRGNEKI